MNLPPRDRSIDHDSAESEDGSASANEALELVYDQLRQIAERRMSKERPDHTLGATALVHEAYLRLVRHGRIDWEGPGHFYVAASEAMRRILIDHARRRGRLKRGGQRKTIRSVVDLASSEETDDIFALDEALEILERDKPTRALVVRLRFYAGLTVDETASALNKSVRSVEREWARARRWLHETLREDVDHRDKDTETDAE